ncbi:Sua5/YciO/YrdC/YwlC family protein [Candidatus Gracilibacteria bacterium]|nr:Sua5/YciO/YrdC/YwlC family protein [Candidatus Gracilibacteria bacterium]
MIYILPTDTCYGIACPLDDKKNYEKIYKIKKRDFGKPLAIMVESFAWLRENTYLTDKQVDFLERYEKPFTILTYSDPVELFLKYGDTGEEHFINKDVYERVAFRVASQMIDKDLVAEHGPIWLTSANLSGTGESYTLEKIEKDFEYYVENNIVEVLGGYDLNPNIPASDIFEFVGESLEVEYMRKG